MDESNKRKSPHGNHHRRPRPLATRVIRKEGVDATPIVKADEASRIRRSAPFSPQEVFEEAKIEKAKLERSSRHSHRPRPRPANKHFTKMPSRGNDESGKNEHHKPIPPAGDNIRIIPLGGVEEVGRNMTAIEYKGDIIVIDIGFGFKDEDTPGIDYILPNSKYLEENKDRVKAVFITHGHLDHIGGVAYIMPKIGNPPLYSRQFGAIMIKKRQEEFPQFPPLDIRIIEGNETITINEHLKVSTFPISHTIPDSMGLIIKTPIGEIVFIEDVRVDNMNGVPTEEEIEQYKKFKDRDVLLLTMDSTSIEKKGFSLSETTVAENIQKIIRDVKGRLIIATFASQVERIMAIIRFAESMNKKVAIEGRSMKNNIEIIKNLKLLEPKNIIPIEEIDNYPPDRIVMLMTGGQGEEFAALVRIAAKNHKYVRLKPTDTILLSSSIIPTNFSAIIKLKDNLYRSEAKIITYLDSDIHASGHGNRDELKWIHNQINYKFFIPLHGNHYMLRQHAEMAESLGKVPKENIVVPDNGSIIEISADGKSIGMLKEKAPSAPAMVDGFSVGDMQEVVIRDRQLLAGDGMFVIIASVNSQTGKLKKSPDIISRGFVYLRENQELLRQARIIIKKTIEDNAQGQHPINFEYLKTVVTDQVARFLFQKTAKRPIVIPVLLGV